MSAMEYCLKVQDGLRAKRPADPRENGWFGDTGRASSAVTCAIEGQAIRALHIAEALADKWLLEV